MIKNYRLSNTELKEMADVVSDAFMVHDNFKTIIHNENRRKKAMYNLFLMMYRVINNYGTIFTVYKDSEIAGYITFMDAGDKDQISAKRVIKTNSFRYIIRYLLSLRLKELRMFMHYNKKYNIYHNKEYFDTIHLYSTGVKSNFKGQGIMSNAIRETFEYFKEKGYKKMILETSDEKNLFLYNKLGFKVDEIVKLDYSQIYFYSKDLTR